MIKFNRFNPTPPPAELKYSNNRSGSSDSAQPQPEFNLNGAHPSGISPALANLGAQLTAAHASSEIPSTPVELNSDTRLTDNDISKNHEWIRGLRKITVGFDMDAPGSGHVGASKTVLRKLVKIIGTDQLASDKITIHVVGDQEKSKALQASLEKEFNHPFAVETPPPPARPGRTMVSKKGQGSAAAQPKKASLMIFGGLDQPDAHHVCKQTGAVANCTLAIQPPYFTRYKSVLTGLKVETDLGVSSRHIFTDETPSDTVTTISTSEVLSEIKSYKETGAEVCVLYEGGTGAGLKQQDAMVQGLNKLDKSSVMVIINNTEFNRQLSAQEGSLVNPPPRWFKRKMERSHVFMYPGCLSPNSRH